MSDNQYLNPSVEFLKEVKNSTDFNWKVSTIRKIFDVNPDEFFLENQEVITNELGDFIAEHKDVILELDQDDSEETSENNSENN